MTIKKVSVLSVALVGLSMLLLAGCRTTVGVGEGVVRTGEGVVEGTGEVVEGIGEDLDAAGEALSDEDK